MYLIIVLVSRLYTFCWLMVWIRNTTFPDSSDSRMVQKFLVTSPPLTNGSQSPWRYVKWDTNYFSSSVESFFTRKRSDSLLACATDSLTRGFCDTSGFQFFGCCFTRNSESRKNRMLSQANAANEGNISTREEKFSISKRPCNFLLNPHAT